MVTDVAFEIDDYCGAGCTIAQGLSGKSVGSTSENIGTGVDELTVSHGEGLTAATIQSYEGKVCGITLR